MTRFLIIVLGLISGHLFAIGWCKTLRFFRKERLFTRGEYVFHHTWFIVPAVVWAIILLLFSANLSLFVLSGGIGIVIQDVLKDKSLNFITKEPQNKN